MITLIIELILAISLIITILGTIKQGKQIDGLQGRIYAIENNIKYLGEKSEKTYSHNAYTVANKAVNKAYELESRVEKLENERN